jgi:hypothetical protein
MRKAIEKAGVEFTNGKKPCDCADELAPKLAPDSKAPVVNERDRSQGNQAKAHIWSDEKGPQKTVLITFQDRCLQPLGHPSL